MGFFPIAGPEDIGPIGKYPEGTSRSDMEPLDALAELSDLWGSGALDDRNAKYDLEEVMGHVERLINVPVPTEITIALVLDLSPGEDVRDAVATYFAENGVPDPVSVTPMS